MLKTHKTTKNNGVCYFWQYMPSVLSKIDILSFVILNNNGNVCGITEKAVSNPKERFLFSEYFRWWAP